MELWHVRLGGHRPDLVNAWLTVCQPEERARYERLVAPDARWRFAQGRLAAQLILARHTGAPVRFVQGEHPAGRDCNWSRSGDHLLLGLGSCGVDVEARERRATVDEPGVWELITSEFERGLPREVLRVWTLKESAVKAVGLGLRIDVRTLRPLRALPRPGQPVTLLDGWETRAVDLGEDAYAAVTTRPGEPLEPRRAWLDELLAEHVA